MKLRVKDLSTAGLPDEGVYGMDIISAKEVSGTSSPEKGGEDWCAIDVGFRLTSNAAGDLRNTPHVYDRFFISSDSGLDRFMKLFEAITGYIPSEGELEDGEITVDTEDMLDEIRDREVFGVVIYGKPGKDGKVRANTGWSFADNLDGVSIPRALREASA